MDASLVVAIISLALATASIGAQITTWVLEGGRAKLTLVHGALALGGVVSGPVGRDGKPRDLSSLRAQGPMGAEVVGVTVANVGRAPLRVTSYGVKLTRPGLSFTPVGDAIGPSLPYTIEPGSSETWFAEMRSARALVATAGEVLTSVSNQVYMTVSFGTGRVRRTRRTLVVK